MVLGWNKSPKIPSLSNGVDAISPLLVMVGGITFYFERRAFGLVTSQHPINPTASTMRREDEKT
jgi:hypothetical protein